jgi:hypothetical protein
MKKTIIIAVTLFMACLTFNACGKKKVSIDKLKSQIKEAMLDEARNEGNTLVITEFTLEEDGNGNYKGVARCTKNDSVKAVYNITVQDSGDDFDAEWNLVEGDKPATASPDSIGGSPK